MISLIIRRRFGFLAEAARVRLASARGHALSRAFVERAVLWADVYASLSIKEMRTVLYAAELLRLRVLCPALALGDAGLAVQAEFESVRAHTI